MTFFLGQVVHAYLLLRERDFLSLAQVVVCYTAVFSVVTQRSPLSGQGALRDDTKNGCVAN